MNIYQFHSTFSKNFKHISLNVFVYRNKLKEMNWKYLKHLSKSYHISENLFNFLSKNYNYLHFYEIYIKLIDLNKKACFGLKVPLFPRLYNFQYKFYSILRLFGKFELNCWVIFLKHTLKHYLRALYWKGDRQGRNSPKDINKNSL